MKANISEKGKIAYRFSAPAYPENTLYLNIIVNYACTNNCRFCSRPRKSEDIGEPNIYEKKAGSFLFLPTPPSIEEVMAAIDEEIKPDDKEIAIIGVGEPLIYAGKVLEIIRRVKEGRFVSELLKELKRLTTDDNL